MSDKERFVFIVEWFDSQASIIRKYNLTYYLSDNTIDMFDIKNKRIFLKRTAYDGISLEDLDRQIIQQERLVCFGQSKLPGRSGMLNRRAR